MQCKNKTNKWKPDNWNRSIFNTRNYKEKFKGHMQTMQYGDGPLFV